MNLPAMPGHSSIGRKAAMVAAADETTGQNMRVPAIR